MDWTKALLNPSQYKEPHPSWVDPALPDFVLIQRTARAAGYSIAIHGSLKRDVDLIAVPWTTKAVDWPILVENLCKALNANLVGQVEQKPFGRIGMILQIDGYYKNIDLSITDKV